MCNDCDHNDICNIPDIILGHNPIGCGYTRCTFTVYPVHIIPKSNVKSLKSGVEIDKPLIFSLHTTTTTYSTSGPT